MKTSSKRSSTLYETEAVAASALAAEPEDRAASALIQKLLEFCHLLRAYELEVTPGRIIDTFRALTAVNIFRREDFYTLLEANVISRASDRELFQQLFAQFWRGPNWTPISDPCLPVWDDGCELLP